MSAPKGDKTQPIHQHLRELRARLLVIIAALLLGSGLGYGLHEKLFAIIRKPLNEPLYYTTPTGGFNALLKVSILFGTVVAVPVVIYQIARFLAPAFRRHAKAPKIFLSSVGLAIGGVLFAYFISLPAALHFLANIDDKQLESLLSVNDYLNFVFSYITAFAVLFQLPLIMLFINWIKPLRPGGLMRLQRWVILVSFILAAIFTPTPDPMNQILMAAPIILLYQVSVMVVWVANRRRRAHIAIEPQIISPQLGPTMAEADILPDTTPLIMDISPQGS